jgi:hypothetical protein
VVNANQLAVTQLTMIPLLNAHSLDIINIHCILCSMNDTSVVGNDDYALALICAGLNVVDSLAN